VVQAPPLQGVLGRGCMHICTRFLSSTLGGDGHHRRKGPSYWSSRRLGGPRAILNSWGKGKAVLPLFVIELRFQNHPTFSLARRIYICCEICAVCVNVLWCFYLSRNELRPSKKLYSCLSVLGMCAGRSKA